MYIMGTILVTIYISIFWYTSEWVSSLSEWVSECECYKIGSTTHMEPI